MFTDGPLRLFNAILKCVKLSLETSLSAHFELIIIDKVFTIEITAVLTANTVLSS